MELQILAFPVSICTNLSTQQHQQFSRSDLLTPNSLNLSRSRLPFNSLIKKMGAVCKPATGTLRGEVDGDGVDRSAIVRNAKGSEEPNSSNPELWNIDGTEMDWNGKYVTGGQMWYLQSRAKENLGKGKPVAGYPINDKALKAGRNFKADDD